MNYQVRTTCRACGSPNLRGLFSLGTQYVSDFPKVAEDGVPIPIVLDRCQECTLVQARNTPPPERLYQRQYWYHSSTSNSMCSALKDVAEAVEARVKLEPGDVVLDIGSNDGQFLRSYSRKDVFKVGVEPANNLVIDGSRGIDKLIHGFWDWRGYAEAMAADGTRKQVKLAKVVSALGMFYDLCDSNQFIRDVALALHPQGIFVAQLMCLKQTLAMNDVGNLAHEHLSFFTLKSLARLFARWGLKIFDVEENSVNGGSYRLWVKHAEQKKGNRSEAYAETTARQACDHRGMSARMKALFDLEDETCSDEAVKAFVDRVKLLKMEVKAFLKQQREAGKRIWIAGASTKGNVIAQWLGLDAKIIEGAADRNPEKWGRVMVGSGIPICSEEQARLAKPDFMLVLPYSLVKEIKERERDQEWRRAGGKFIVPIPELKLL